MAYSLGIGAVGNDVRRLQDYLNHELTASLAADGDYGGKTKEEVLRFRSRFGLAPSPVFDEQCSRVAEPRGYHFPKFDPDPAKKPLSWPKKMKGLTSPKQALMQTKCGVIEFFHSPVPGNPEHISITNSYVADNIVNVEVPQLRDCIIIGDHDISKSSGRIQFHKDHASRIKTLFADWDAAGLTDRILSYDGAFNARLIRGHTGNSFKDLSNHAWGTAIDINATWNKRNTIPAMMGDRGCIRELVAIAHANGFYWGGHFGTKDGMHFEVAAETL